MINIRTLRKIENNGGLTLKNGKVVTYKTGWPPDEAPLQLDPLAVTVYV